MSAFAQTVLSFFLVIGVFSQHYTTDKSVGCMHCDNGCMTIQGSTITTGQPTTFFDDFICSNPGACDSGWTGAYVMYGSYNAPGVLCNTQCGANCEHCSVTGSGTTCKTCVSGYGLENNVCSYVPTPPPTPPPTPVPTPVPTPLPTPACDALFPNCLACNPGESQCVSCASGFFVDTGSGQCVTPSPTPVVGTGVPTPAPVTCPGITCAAMPSTCTRSAITTSEGVCPSEAEWCNAVCTVTWRLMLKSSMSESSLQSGITAQLPEAFSVAVMGASSTYEIYIVNSQVGLSDATNSTYVEDENAHLLGIVNQFGTGMTQSPVPTPAFGTMSRKIGTMTGIGTMATGAGVASSAKSGLGNSTTQTAIIAGSVAGGVLLVLIIVAVVVARRGKKDTTATSTQQIASQTAVDSAPTSFEAPPQRMSSRRKSRSSSRRAVDVGLNVPRSSRRIRRGNTGRSRRRSSRRGASYGAQPLSPPYGGIGGVGAGPYSRPAPPPASYGAYGAPAPSPAMYGGASVGLPLGGPAPRTAYGRGASPIVPPRSGNGGALVAMLPPPPAAYWIGSGEAPRSYH